MMFWIVFLDELNFYIDFDKNVKMSNFANFG